ncbi:phage shock protein B, partial [Prevotella dentalis DSM 3688]
MRSSVFIAIFAPESKFLVLNIIERHQRPQHFSNNNKGMCVAQGKMNFPANFSSNCLVVPNNLLLSLSLS